MALHSKSKSWSPGVLKDRLNDNDTYNIQLPGTTAPLCACCQLFDRAPHALHLDVMSPWSYYSTAARTTEKYRRQHLNLFILFHLDSFYNSIPSCSQSDNRNHNDERIDFSFLIAGWDFVVASSLHPPHHQLLIHLFLLLVTWEKEERGNKDATRRRGNVAYDDDDDGGGDVLGKKKERKSWLDDGKLFHSVLSLLLLLFGLECWVALPCAFLCIQCYA